MKKSAVFLGLLFAFTLIFASTASAVQDGAAYVKKKCKACHVIPGVKTKGKKIGPPLAGVGKRTNAAWLDKWLTNPKKAWKEGGDYIDNVLKKRDGAKKKTRMIVKIKDKAQREAVIKYLLTL